MKQAEGGSISDAGPPPSRGRPLIEWSVVVLAIVAVDALRLYFMSPYSACCSNDLLNYILSPGGTESVPPPAAAFGQLFISLFGLKYGSMALTTFVGSLLMVVTFLFFRTFLKPATAIAAFTMSILLWPVNVLVSFNAMDTYLGVVGWLWTVRSISLISPGGAQKQYYLLALSLAFSLSFSLPSFGFSLLSALLIAVSKFHTPSRILGLMKGLVRYSLPVGIVAGGYGAIYWAQQYLSAGRGILNTPNLSPLTVAGIRSLGVWFVSSYGDPLWLVVFIISVAEAVMLLRKGDSFLTALYLSALLAIFTALYAFPDRITIYLWVPILLGFGIALEKIWWMGTGAQPLVSESDEEENSSLYITG